METKEQWITTTMESLEGISPAEGDPLLHERVMPELRKPHSRIIPYNPRIAWQIAAGLALLISINIFSIVTYNKSHKVSQTDTNPIASEYFSYIETIKL
jgi:hypothetical protein